MTLSDSQLVDLYRMMWKIRAFELQVVDLYKHNLIRGSTHVYLGEEAIATGVCAALQPADLIVSTHRGHGHVLAKGGEPKRMMAELLGRAEGYCKGKGGSMHIADLDLGILGANGIVGGGLALAAGAALSCQYRGTDQVAVCFFGDGAYNQGPFHETANLAAIWSLPLVFVCENNQFALSTRANRSMAVDDLSLRAAGYGFPGQNVDGNDVLAVLAAAEAAVARARAGEGPSLIVAKSYRWEGHMVGDPQEYRSRQEVEEQMRDCPIVCFREELIARGVLDETAARQVEADMTAAALEAVEFAKQCAEPALETLTADVYAEDWSQAESGAGR
jgi:TPP-dependent pyruvate/acetoin dehydrogenase alpha subunit